MGWNDARLSLLPLGSVPIIETSRVARIANGAAVRVIGSAPVERSPPEGISVGSLRQWLQDRGFKVSQESLCSTVMNREEIEAFVASADHFVSEVILTFTLNSHSAYHVPAWEELVASLHEEWRLGLVDAQASRTVSPKEFRRLLFENDSWREFSVAHSWPSIVGRTQGSGAEALTQSLTVKQEALNQVALAKEDNNLATAMLPAMEQTWSRNEAA